MNKIENRLMTFIDKTPNAYYCVANLRNILETAGFEELYENEVWNLEKDGKYFVTRGDSSIIAFKINHENSIKTGFNITATHNDSPNFIVKPHPEIKDEVYVRLNTECYGALINYTWFDRPLSIAGRVIIEKDGEYIPQLINIDQDMLVIPSQSIHFNREVNKNASFNPQEDMLPLLSINKESSVNTMIRNMLILRGLGYFKICDYDLSIYNRDKAKIIGANKEMILSPRLDDLASVYPAAQAFIDSSNNNSINVFCALNNEEIGSLTAQGADSTFLIDTLSRISKQTGLDLYKALKNSFIVSADNAHAINPNVPEKSDPTNKVYLNKGIAIKHHPEYTTDSITASIFKGICENASVPYQDFTVRSDLISGTTLGGISQSHVSVDSVDIGIPQLAMHSANETIGLEDVYHMYNSMLEFYNSTIIKEKGRIRILTKQ